MVICTPTKITCIVEFHKTGQKFNEKLESTACHSYSRHKDNNNFYYCPSRPGCPWKLSQYELHLAVHWIHNGQACEASDLQWQEFPHVSTRTVSWALTQEGFLARRHWRKFFLNAKHVAKRQFWANTHVIWGVKKWKWVVFMDKSKFNLFRFDGLQWCRRGPGEEYDVRNVDAQVKHGRGILMVWVALLWEGFGRLHQVKGKMDHFQDMEILQESLLGTLRGQYLSTCDVIFQQDNNLKHIPPCTGLDQGKSA